MLNWGTYAKFIACIVVVYLGFVGLVLYALSGLGH